MGYQYAIGYPYAMGYHDTMGYQDAMGYQYAMNCMSSVRHIPSQQDRAEMLLQGRSFWQLDLMIKRFEASYIYEYDSISFAHQMDFSDSWI